MASRVLKWASAAGLVAICSVGPAISSSKPNGSSLEQHGIGVEARAIRSFSKSGGRGDRFGRLRFRGGLVLRSSDAAFGGFSGLEISPDGGSIIAISDAGAWLKAKLLYDGERPSRLGNVIIGPIKALASRRLSRGRDRDAEAVRLLSGNLSNGNVLISFEINHRVGFFDLKNGDLKSPQRYLRPPIRLARNKGIEAVGVIRTGKYKQGIIAFAERSLDSNRHHRGWLWLHTKGKSPSKPLAIGLTNIGDFDITDAVGAFDGGIYILERRFRWSEGIKMRIRRIPADSIKPGVLLTGETLIEADFSYEIDNMEGLAVHRGKHGETLLTIISDDNFNSFLQRTILLQFEEVGQQKQKSRAIQEGAALKR